LGVHGWDRKANEIKPLCIGGVADHVHLLLSLRTTMSVAKAMQLIKGGSSAWAHETFTLLRQFAWQSGYGAFTVSVSHVAETITYIQNQVEHHRFKSFQEEYVSFLRNTASALKNDIFGIDRAAVFGRPSGTRPHVVPNPAINRRATIICPSGTRYGRRLRPRS
jgi:Transposase IS200 like